MMNQWIIGILGLVVAGITLFDLSESALTWTLVIVGLAITIISFSNMSASTTGK